ncbi:ABC transporter permease [Aeromicrobium sp. CTD01-1L150]|uniref:ABC transporter permease n=1 Tax=Aeromicrobium sp. CTD01-1L150 TaxID=3341830 RepID=UPI0035C14B83
MTSTPTRSSGHSTAGTVLRTEFKLFTREPAALFWIVVFPPLLLGILGLIPDFREVGEDGVSVISLYVSIMPMVAMLFAAVATMPTVVAAYREQRVLRRLSTTPARPRDLLLAQYVLHGAAALLGSILAIVVAIVAFDVTLPQNMVGFIGVMLIVLAASLAIGGLVTGLAPTAKIATTLGTVLLFPLMFTAGLWLPVSAMPDLLGDIVTWTPFGAAALALDATVQGDWPSLVHVLVVAGWAVVTGALAARYFRWE